MMSLLLLFNGPLEIPDAPPVVVKTYDRAAASIESISGANLNITSISGANLNITSIEGWTKKIIMWLVSFVGL